MSKQTKWIIGFIAGFFIVLVFALDIWLKAATWYKGDRTKNPTEYNMEFTSMHTKDSHTMHMRAGQYLSVQIGIEKGEMDVEIEKKGEEPIYSADNVTSEDTFVEIPSDGDYVITVRGKRAKGYMYFKISAPIFD
ncbi:MAG: hypothetical protein Q4D54_06705 [Eubacteriales bacterium]|nr:hypothetical protein [Eubacteriales bacterium]